MQFFFENEPVPQPGITDVKFEDQVAVVADPRTEREIMLTESNLLVGDFQTFFVPKDGFGSENRNLAHVRTQRASRCVSGPAKARLVLGRLPANGP